MAEHGIVALERPFAGAANSRHMMSGPRGVMSGINTQAIGREILSETFANRFM